jgi:thiamine biosynthesis lipoprotein
LTQGALATSGDRHRFIEHEKKRYSHVLNPKSGWPIEGGPRSITLAAPTCIQAGLMATLALLQGKDAKSFITMTGFNYWIYE